MTDSNLNTEYQDLNDITVGTAVCACYGTQDAIDGVVVETVDENWNPIRYNGKDCYVVCDESGDCHRIPVDLLRFAPKGSVRVELCHRDL